MLLFFFFLLNFKNIRQIFVVVIFALKKHSNVASKREENPKQTKQTTSEQNYRANEETSKRG